MKVFIRTYGCQMNERDSEIIAAQLMHDGHTIVNDESVADVVILNTCSVREQAEIKAIGKSGYLSRIKRRNPNFRVGIVGCMAENLGPQLFELNSAIDFVVGPQRIHEITGILHSREKNLLIGEGNFAYTHHDFDHNLCRGKCTAFVSIMQGCCMRCSYCIVPKTRGAERYREINDIVDEVHFLAENGIKEITLLGQIVNNFGGRVMPIINKKRPFIQLLEKLNDIDGIERIRYMSPHPSFFTDDLIDAHRSLKKLCRAVHLPIQSGSNRILREMRRPYTREKIVKIIEKLRAAVPDIGISTDIIVGYPTETEEDFLNTVSLVKDIKFNMAFVFKYSQRPGTKSAELPDDVSEREKCRRNKILLNIIEDVSLTYNKNFKGTVVEVLIEGHAKRGDDVMFGYTSNHYKVLFNANEEDIGRIVNVRIKDYTTTVLIGEIV